jgi:hypothetical protein
MMPIRPSRAPQKKTLGDYVMLTMLLLAAVAFSVGVPYVMRDLESLLAKLFR